MGLQESTPSGAQNTSYYGTSTRDITPDNAMETIREIQLEKLNQRLAKDRANETPRFKTPLSLTNMSIKHSGQFLVFVCQIKSDTPGQAVIIANGKMSSFNFPKIAEKTVCSIPIPTNSDFMIEITIDYHHYHEIIPPNTHMVKKHIYEFKLLDSDSIFRVQYVSQTVVSTTKTCKIDVNKPIEVIDENLTGKCLFCLANEATTDICDKDHKVYCDACKEEKSIKLAECPYDRVQPVEQPLIEL
ncbi:hypothetical protein TVAG_436370 [Trichomonas vaginalis G3]|uniref:Uncharacterized protein n=1 Tax=Trichomonas vaginalis (strain ATCC PRA-98 / G3) TaxID=412133 RepID=A2DF85_TRIV3|nr:hypothetical protein TVAGG3_0565920 [Trichomonas vaginalis G3]EAY20813.1 hypothetical protein TVAG_436370 [Trichomonas vaginalis G3]KAI5521579.1 hypothetical protein TVAGG3_0565920 [Trichomonas vaginalis G3]|eukprot:XP_001581799.1 hypothetical protein [Trichomonas vaginalis G3]